MFAKRGGVTGFRSIGIDNSLWFSKQITFEFEKWLHKSTNCDQFPNQSSDVTSWFFFWFFFFINSLHLQNRTETHTQKKHKKLLISFKLNTENWMGVYEGKKPIFFYFARQCFISADCNLNCISHPLNAILTCQLEGGKGSPIVSFLNMGHKRTEKSFLLIIL